MPRIPLQAVQQHWGTACFVDVETTGLSGGDEIVELAMVLFA
jgi:DNA polymerase III epsilon subunit-like protein